MDDNSTLHIGDRVFNLYVLVRGEIIEIRPTADGIEVVVQSDGDRIVDLYEHWYKLEV